MTDATDDATGGTLPRDPDVDAGRRADVAVAAARAGAEVALEHFRGPLDVDTKRDATDYVTQADRDSQERIVETILEAFPDHAIVAEEGDGRKSVPDEGPAWIIDPVDGTYEFVHGIPFWAVSVAAVEDGEAVAAANAVPALGEYYVADGTATRRDESPVTVSDRTDPETLAVGIIDWDDVDADPEPTGIVAALSERFGEVRRLGSSQTTLTYVANGALDAAISTNPNAWNNVAGAHLVDRAGGAVTDLAGDPWRHEADHLIVSNGAAHDALLDVARDHRA